MINNTINPFKKITLPIAVFISLLILYPMVSFSIKALSDFYQYQDIVDPDMQLNLQRFHFFLKNRVLKTYIKFTAKTPLSNKQSQLKTFDITIDPNHISQLNSNLPKSGKENYYKAYLKITLPDEGEKASIRKIKLRYRGDNNYHWLNDKKSLRIKLKGGVYEMEKTFNLLNPVELSSFRDVVNYNLAKKIGLIAPDCYPVRVTINGQFMGVYLYLSQVDENLLRKYKRMPGSIYYGDLGVIDKVEFVWDGQEKWAKKASRNKQQKNDRKDISLLIHAIKNYSQLEFIDFTETYLNKEAFFKFIALDRLFGSHHHDFVHNHKLYFDPYKGKFEPIAWDIRFWNNRAPKDRSIFPIQLKLANHPPYDAQIDRIVYSQLSDQSFDSLLTQYEATVKKLLPDIQRDIFRDTAVVSDLISKKTVSKPFFISQLMHRLENDKIILRQRFDYLKKLYEKVDLRYSSYRSNNQLIINFSIGGNNPVTMDLSQLSQYKIEQNVSGKWEALNKQFILYPGRHIVANSQNFLPVDAYGDATVQAQDNHYQIIIASKNSILPANILNKISYKNMISNQKVIPRKIDNQSTDLKKIKNYSYYKIHKENKTLILSGTIEVTHNRIYPKSTQVIIEPGTHFIMHPKASLFFYGKLLAKGTLSQPIVFTAKDKTKPWGIIAIQGQSANGSQLSYCHIEGGSISSRNLIDYTAPLSLHDVNDFVVSHSLIGKNYIGDDAMHIAYAQGTIKFNKFTDARSDALDIDISNVTVSHNSFYNSGNDALDIMTTELRADHNYFEKTGDKGISVGEWSHAEIQKSIFIETHIALEVKDQSSVIAKELLIKHTQEKAINLYHKNKRYNEGGILDAIDIAFVGNDRVSVDDDSHLNSISIISAHELMNSVWYQEIGVN